MTSKPRLLWVGNYASVRQGMKTISQELTERLIQSGWQTITVSRHEWRVHRMLDIVFSILYFRHKYDLACVEVYSGAAFFWAEISSILLSWLDKPLVLVLHGGGLAEFANRNSGRVVRLLKRGKIVVTPSHFLQKELCPLLSNIRHLPNGLDVSAYPFRLRNKPGLTLIWVRAFHHIYQPQLAVRVLAELTAEFSNIQLIMIGPDKKDGSLEAAQQEARRLNVFEHISIPGLVPKEEIPAWLNRADIFLNTTFFESFGVSVMEAAACGLPIVTTNVGELPFLWKDGDDALLVCADDPSPMTNAIRRLLLEDGLASSLSRKARQKTEQYDWKVILPQWERLFYEVVID